MQYKIFQTYFFSFFLFSFSTYALSKSLWMLGLKGKVESFGKLWGAISLLVGSIASAIGLIVLFRLL